MKYICPDCQKPFNEPARAEDYVTNCPSCSLEISILADPTLVAKVQRKLEENEKEEKARAEELQRQKDAQKADEDRAKIIALIPYSMRRICPHCKNESIWKFNALHNVEKMIVQCEHPACYKKFTIMIESGDLVGYLSDIHHELGIIRYRFGVLLFCLFVIPFICGVIVAIISANR